MDENDDKTAFASIPILRDAGATILAGSNAANPGTAQGASIHEEIEMLVRCGFSPAQALTAATSAPARVWRFKDRGRVAAGLLADLLLVNGDPTQEITAMQDFADIWLVGCRVDRTSLLEKIRSLKPESHESQGRRAISPVRRSVVLI